MALSPELKNIVAASNRHAASTLPHLRSDLSELVPELESWPIELSLLPAVDSNLLWEAHAVRARARAIGEMIAAAPNSLQSHTSVIEAEIRRLEMDYDMLKVSVLAALEEVVIFISPE